MAIRTGGKAIFAALCLFVLSAVPAFSLPSSFCDDYDGFLELNFICTWDFSNKGPGFGVEFGGGGEGFWGLDFGVVHYASRGFFGYVGGQYFLNPGAAENQALPLRFRLGVVVDTSGVSWGLSALGGMRFYPILLRYSEEHAEDLAFGVGGSVGLHYWNGAFFPSLEADASFAMSLSPSSGGIYYYYY